MKTIWCMALAFLTLVPSSFAEKWETDFEKAKEMARDSNRYLLINFTGSDWCGWCIKLDEEVFSKKAFKQYAEDNLVPVTIDFPRRKQLKKSLQEQNEALMKQYGVRGFPTILILSPSGETVAQTGYQAGGAEKYVEHLQGYIDPHRAKNNIPAPSGSSSGAEKSRIEQLKARGAGK